MELTYIEVDSDNWGDSKLTKEQLRQLAEEQLRKKPNECWEKGKAPAQRGTPDILD
jgi:hypothetical protein